MGGCHDDQTVEWAADHYRQWYGRATKPHFGTTFAAAREGAPEAEAELARMSADTLYPSIVRATALSLLVRYPGDESHAALTRGLQDEDALVRLTAAEAVAPATQEESLQLLLPLLFDPVKAIRLSAASRLAGTPRERLKDYQREQLGEALVEFHRAMERSLDFPFAGYNLGNLHMSLQQPEQAEAYYRTAIEIDDRFFPAKMNLALLLNSLGRNDEAEILLREIIEADPDNVDAAYAMGFLLVEVGRLEEALEIADRMIAGNPENPIGQQLKGLIEAGDTP
jgi:tetratricopeptide (TPR) repeat protein